jgi:hypothetical protein
MLSASGHNFPEWLKEILIYADTHHGKVGQDIRHETSSPLLNPDPGAPTAPLPEPNYFSPRIHPRTGQPIPGTRLYERRELTEVEDALLALALEAETDEEGIDIFDFDIVELTQESQTQLLRDQDNHRRTSDKQQYQHTKASLAYNTEFDGRKHQDDAFFDVILSTVTTSSNFTFSDISSLPQI